ncbi:MAG TPA: hypothetical protein DEB31_00660 [Clostridiales bacterium]|nr:hypothetical protein [Clostridiales bacterium]
MIKMIIADDERLIRESLHQLMDWKSVGVEVVGVAADGEAALELVRTLSPQILLSDISMPRLDGIGLLTKIKEEKLNCRVIFLSAYSNFSYAQSAVKYGAFDYILKPIDEDLLMETVVRCVQAVKEEAQAALPGENDTDRFIANTALCGLLLSPNPPAPHDVDILSSCGIDLAGNDLCIGALLHSDEKQPSHDIPPLPGNLEQIIIQNTAVFSDDEKLVLWTGHSLSREKLLRDFSSCLSNFYRALHGVFISNPHPVSEIKQFYAECSFAMLYPRLGFETSTHRFCDGAIILNENYPHVYAAEVLKAIQKKDATAVKALADRMFWRFAQNGQIYDTDLIKLKCITLLDSLREDLYFTDGPTKDPDSDMLITAKKLINIQHAVSNIYDETLAALLRFCAYFESIENFGGSLLVAQAVDYIKENYASASLADIAEKLYVSPTYLSRIFAAEMKDTFSRYVQKYRVKISKKLLLDPQYKIYNIAKMVGYSDVAHFSKAFKQVEGISPMKFKNISNQGGRITGQEK